MANHVTFPEVATTGIRAVLHHQPAATSGLTELEAWSADALPLSPATEPVAGLARGIPGDRAYPKVSASYTSSNDQVKQAVDGRLSFTRYSRNRWTAYQSPNATDWIEVDFGTPRTVGRVDLYLYGDGRGVAAPRDVRIERWTGTSWVDTPIRARTPEAPTAWALNILEFAAVQTSRLRAVFTHDLPASSGLTELRIWPKYPARQDRTPFPAILPCSRASQTESAAQATAAGITMAVRVRTPPPILPRKPSVQAPITSPVAIHEGVDDRLRLVPVLAVGDGEEGLPGRAG